MTVKNYFWFSAFLFAACTAKQATHAQEYKLAVSAEDDLGIPCSLDLSSMVTEEKMKRFNPNVQRLLYRAERVVCRFYEGFVQEQPMLDDYASQQSLDFRERYFGGQVFVELGNAYRTYTERRLATEDFVEVVQMALEHNFPGKTKCVNDTVNLFKTVYKLDPRGADKAWVEFMNARKTCGRWVFAETVEPPFIIMTTPSFAECHYNARRLKDGL